MPATSLWSEMFNSYRAILSHPGALLFSATGLIGRLPISMFALGMVLLISEKTGSYGLAGAVSGSALLANAAMSILQGRLIDRLGQHRVLPVAITVFGVFLAILMWSVESGWPHWTTFTCAIVAGAALPPVGSCVRARWSFVLDKPAQVSTAYALEAVVDEAVFMTGPIIVTVLATTWHPLAGLSVAILTGVGGTWALAAQRRTEPVVAGRATATADRPRMPWRTVAPLTVVALALGALFGSTEVVAVAFSREHDATSYAGVLLALWAFGSLLAGFITGAITWRATATKRLRIGAVSMACAMAPLPLIGSMWLMGVALFVGGFAIAPTLIATMSLVEQSVPSVRLTEGMAFIHTGLAAGIAPGATIGGLVIDAHGAAPAFLVALAAGLVAAVSALALPSKT